MVPYITLGFVSLLLQLTVLRELLMVFSGNELDIGITLSLWLVSVGAGSFAGSRLRVRNAFALSFLLVALLAEPTVYGIGFIRPLLGLGYGEAASLGGTFIGTALVLFPLCFSLGLQFPLAVSFKGGKTPAAAVYGLEAAGAFAGGVLFTFLISGRVEAAGLAVALSLVCVIMAALILRKKAVIAAFVIPFLVHAGVGLLKPSRFEGGELLKKVQSRYGEIWVTSLGQQISLYGSGQYLFSYPDHQSEEMSVHLPMAIKPSAKRVLALGGSPAALREFLKYPVERVDFIEIDPALLKTSLGVLDEEDRRALEDERVRIVIEDGRRFIKSLGRAEYDMLVMNLSPPSTANLNRFYTVEFFQEARAVLRPGGVLALRLPSSAGYVGRRMQLANGSIYNSLRSVFPYVELTTEEYGGLFASDSPIEISPEKLINEFNQRGLDLKHFHFYVLADAFMPMRAEFHKKRLGAVDALNTDVRPSAYLYNLMLWAEVHGGVFLKTVLSFKGLTIALVALGVFIAVALGVLRRRTRTLYYSMFTTGYAAMALVLAIVLGYQASYGYVYEMMGLLGAVFMVGVALGSYALRGGVRGRLMWLEAATVVFALLATYFFKAEILYYLLSFAAGVITGYQFALVNRLMGRLETGPGRLYAVDLAGSFLGAVLSAIILIPMVGIQGSLLFLAGVKSISLFAVSLIKDE